jgi:hypothetical protein
VFLTLIARRERRAAPGGATIPACEASRIAGDRGEMKVKGAALLARRFIITKHFGEDAWTDLCADMASRLPIYSAPLLAASTIPLQDFLAFHDELIRRFYGGSQRAYFALGEQSARWALVEGPYKSFLGNRDFRGFAEVFPRTWTTYFVETSSRCTTEVEGRRVEFRAFDLPVQHPYLEHFVVGYFKGGLELVCEKPIHFCRMHRGSDSYHYVLYVGSAHTDEPDP